MWVFCTKQTWQTRREKTPKRGVPAALLSEAFACRVCNKSINQSYQNYWSAWCLTSSTTDIINHPSGIILNPLQTNCRLRSDNQKYLWICFVKIPNAVNQPFPRHGSLQRKGHLCVLMCLGDYRSILLKTKRKECLITSSCDITLKLLRPYWGARVAFVALSLPSLSASLSSWIDSPFVFDSRDARCWFQLCGSCFIARSMFVCGGFPQFHSAHKRIPSGRAFPSVLCSSAVPEMDRANI